MITKIIAVFGIIFLIALSGSVVQAETRQLSWDAVTTYTDGSPVETWKNVNYTVYWSNDPWLALDTLHTLVPSTPNTSVTFDPAAGEMSSYQMVYFAIRSVLSTGEESVLSDAMPYSPLPPTVTTVVPMPPGNLGITYVSTTGSSGTWKLIWDPSSEDGNGNPIQANTVSYTLYWTTDASLPPESLTILSSSIAETFFEFDSAELGIKGEQRIFFAAKTVLTTGVTIPKMLAAFSYAEEKPKPVAAQKNRPAIRRWIPRNTVTVDIIKGTDTSQKKFSQ